MTLSRKAVEELLSLATRGVRSPYDTGHMAEIRLIERARKALLPQQKRASPGRGSRRKGQERERELVHWLRDQGLFHNAARGRQSRGGGKEEADLIRTGIIHFEVKGGERFDLYPALEQANRDAREGMLPIVAHRRNDYPWAFIISGSVFAHLVREAGLAESKDEDEMLYCHGCGSTVEPEAVGADNGHVEADPKGGDTTYCWGPVEWVPLPAKEGA